MLSIIKIACIIIVHCVCKCVLSKFVNYYVVFNFMFIHVQQKHEMYRPVHTYKAKGEGEGYSQSH